MGRKVMPSRVVVTHRCDARGAIVLADGVGSMQHAPTKGQEPEQVPDPFVLFSVKRKGRESPPLADNLCGDYLGPDALGAQGD
jgi:hypothetical protein